MSIFNENNIKLTNLNYFINQISKIRHEKIIIECNYTSLSQSEYDNFVNLIYDNPFITKIEIVWHDFVKLKVLEKLALAFRKYFDESRKLHKLKLVLSVFKPYPASEMQQNLKSVFSIYAHRISLQVKFRKEFLCFESFFQLLPVPEQNISQFQISIEQTGQIKPLNISFLFAYIQEILLKNQLSRIGVKVKINQVYYQHFNSFLILLQDNQYLKDIELDISELTNQEALLNSFEIPIFKNKLFLDKKKFSTENNKQNSSKKLSFMNNSKCTTQKNSLCPQDFDAKNEQQRSCILSSANKNNFNQNIYLSNYDINNVENKLQKQYSLSINSNKQFTNNFNLARQSSMDQQFQFSFHSSFLSQDKNKTESQSFNKFENNQLQQSTLKAKIGSNSVLINQENKETQNLLDSSKRVHQADLNSRLQQMNQKYKLQINDEQNNLDSFQFCKNKSQQNQKTNDWSNKNTNNQQQVSGNSFQSCLSTCKKEKNGYHFLYEQDINEDNGYQEEVETNLLQQQPNTLRLGNLGKISQKIQYKDLFCNVQKLILKHLEFDLVELLSNLLGLKSLIIQKSCFINISKNFQAQFIPQLEELEVNQENLIPKQSSKLCQLISNMKYLKKFKFQSITNYEDLIKISENLKILEELHLNIELKKGENQIKYIKQVYWNLNRIKTLKKINFFINDCSIDYAQLFGFIKQQKSLEEISLNFYLNKQYINYIKQLTQSLCQNINLTKIQIKLPSVDSQDPQFLIFQSDINKYLKYLTQIDLAIETANFFQQNYLYSEVVQIRCFEKYIQPCMIFNPKLILWDLFLDE
ncbi:hypothetical protein ABPG74_016089 [Tetrahymena malaccensis]